MKNRTQEKNDKFILGGHEFTSRFILGSGKYSLDLIRASVQQAGHRSLHWRCAVPTRTEERIYWIIFRKG